MLEIVNEERLTIRKDNKSPFLNGAFKPNSKEYTADTESLEVIGDIPADLWGVLVRNTHNQVHEPLGKYHPFDGDGMLHAMYFNKGHAEYRNRFIHTTGFLAEKAAGRSLWPGILEPEQRAYRGWGAIGAMKDNAGTDVIHHAGKLLATMSQGSEPWRLDPITLENLGPDPKLAAVVGNNGIAGEFKVDTRTGDMVFLNYPESPPCINIGITNAIGDVVDYRRIDLPSPRWPHDLGITENYIIVHDLPLFFDPDLLKEGKRELRFFPNLPSRFGIVPRQDLHAAVRWFETAPAFILHSANYFEQGEEIVMDSCLSFDPKGPGVGEDADHNERIMAHLDKHKTKTRLHRIRLNLRTGETSQQLISDEIVEFPVCANAYKGHPYRYAYASLFEPGKWLMNGIIKFDLELNKTYRYHYGEDRYGGEVHFAPRTNAEQEDDGYLVVFVQDMKKDRSECVVFNAQAIEEGPIASIVLPERIQTGTHACWVEGERLRNELV
ncbi:MAG: carotenoid oxygenase family protein [Halieaceae bacterium]